MLSQRVQDYYHSPCVTVGQKQRLFFLRNNITVVNIVNYSTRTVRYCIKIIAAVLWIIYLYSQAAEVIFKLFWPLLLALLLIIVKSLIAQQQGRDFYTYKHQLKCSESAVKLLSISVANPYSASMSTQSIKALKTNYIM